MTDAPISPLRRRMIEDMTVRKLAARTQEGYIRAVKGFSAFRGASPDTASAEDLRRYRLHLVASGAGVPTINHSLTALRFFFLVTLRKLSLTEDGARFQLNRALALIEPFPYYSPLSTGRLTVAIDATTKRWEDFLNPIVVRTKLVIAGLFIIAYEMLERAIVERITSFYSIGFDENGPFRNPEYERKVLSLDPKGKRDALRSSLVWLEQHGVLTRHDIDQFITIKNVRNEIAHELSSLIGGTREPPIDDQFGPTMVLLRKVELWWIVNVEIATDRDSAHREFDQEQVVPGTIMAMQILLDVALGNDEEAFRHLKAFQRRRNNSSDKDG